MSKAEHAVYRAGIIGIAAFLYLLFTATTAQAHLTGSPHFGNHNGPRCWCKIRAGCNGPILKDFGSLGQYNAVVSGKQAHCSSACSTAAAQYGLSGLQGQGASACNSTGSGSHKIQAFSIVGHSDTNNNACDPDQTFGTLNCTAIPVVCTCPRGWLANTTNVDGGVTSDGKCKKLVCASNTVSPYPANGTPIGTWGFTWGNGFWAWGSQANGGKAVCTGGGYTHTWTP